MICVLLLMESNVNDEPKFGQYPSSLKIVFVRFACCIALHMQLKSEYQSGMQNMKLVLNHDWRFEDFVLAAFIAGLMQTVTAVLIEVVNLVVILKNDTVIDVVMNFMALEIVANFDNIFYAALGENMIKELVQDVIDKGDES